LSSSLSFPRKRKSSAIPEYHPCLSDSMDSHDDRVDGVTYFNYGEFDAM
jgi:hypothetical protein